MTDASALVIHTDGASRGNPGPAAIGVVITEPSGRVLVEFGEALKTATNNVAEYTAVIRALERALELGARRVDCRLDSQLVVRQLNGSYRVKHAEMLPLYRRVLELVQRFEHVSFTHVPREENAEADRLANLALDRPAEAPQTFVARFFHALVEGKWEDAQSQMADSFRFRRVTTEHELDLAGFLESYKRGQGTRGDLESTRGLGPEVLLEVRARGRPGAAVAWICRVGGGKLEQILEYRDTGG